MRKTKMDMKKYYTEKCVGLGCNYTNGDDTFCTIHKCGSADPEQCRMPSCPHCSEEIKYSAKELEKILVEERYAADNLEINIRKFISGEVTILGLAEATLTYVKVRTKNE